MRNVESSQTYRVSIGNRIGRRIVRAVGRMLYQLFARMKITGLENVPADGAYIIACKPISIFEPTFIQTFGSDAREALGAVEVWREPDKKILAQMCGGIPLDRDEVCREALMKAVQALLSRFVLLMSPEGRLAWQPGLWRAKWIVAYLAEKADVPGLPVGIVGSTGDFLKQVISFTRPRLEMRIGKPVRLPALAMVSQDRREALRQYADRMMLHIAALLPANYCGEYFEPFRNLQGA